MRASLPPHQLARISLTLLAIFTAGAQISLHLYGKLAWRDFDPSPPVLLLGAWGVGRAPKSIFMWLLVLYLAYWTVGLVAYTLLYLFQRNYALAAVEFPQTTWAFANVILMIAVLQARGRGRK